MGKLRKLVDMYKKVVEEKKELERTRSSDEPSSTNLLNADAEPATTQSE